MKKALKLIGTIVLVVVIGFSMVSCGGDDGEPANNNPPPDDPAPSTPPPPTATFAEIDFYPSSWGEEGEYRAEQWETNNQIKLSAFFTSYKPKEGDVLSFKISGVSDKELKYIKIELGECVAGDWSTYNYLGSSWRGEDDGKLVDLSTSFTDVLINVPIAEPTNPNAAIYAQLVNLLWEKDPSGKYVFNSGETLPAGVQKGTVMATIRDFKISLDKIDSSNNIEKNHGWYVWKDDSTTATFDYSVSDDGVCTVTVGGAPETHNETDGWNAWKVSAEYSSYNGKADTYYKFTFEAWTQSGTRDLHVQYYTDNDDGIYLGETITITTTRTTYTIYGGDAIPKDGRRNVAFQLADQLGTVNLKMLELKEYTQGKLTITNFSGDPGLIVKEDDMYITGSISGDPIEIVFAFRVGFDDGDWRYRDKVHWRNVGVDIKDTITISAWEVDNLKRTVVPYSGNKTVTAGNFVLDKINVDVNTVWISIDTYKNKLPITFTNGSATIDFATQMEFISTE